MNYLEAMREGDAPTMDEAARDAIDRWRAARGRAQGIAPTMDDEAAYVLWYNVVPFRPQVLRASRERATCERATTRDRPMDGGGCIRGRDKSGPYTGCALRS
jgi:hypothetical protein